MRIREVILALAVCCSLLLASSAEAQQWSSGSGGWQNNSGDQATAFVNSYVQNQTLDLSSLLNLAQPWRQGEIVDSLTIYTTPTQYGYGSQMALIANGMIVASDGSGASMVTLFPYQVVQLSGMYSQIQLQVRGTVYINQIVMNMHQVNNYPQPPPNPYPPAPYPQPQPQPIPQPPGQGQIVLTADISGMGSSAQVDLAAIMNLDAYRGMRLQSLILIGRSAMAAGVGYATLAINNVQAGQVSFRGMTSTQVMPLHGAWIAGVNAQNMLLSLQGVQTRQVQLVLSR